MDNPSALPDRFWRKVDKTETCWLWTAAIDPRGYARFNIREGGQKRARLAHRLIYVDVHGEIPDGGHIDHKCRVRHCVNPDHLQVVTPALNNQNRGPSSASKTGVRGVTPFGDRFRVTVTVKRKIHHGGLYHTLAEAEVAAIALRNRLMTNNLTDRAAS